MRIEGSRGISPRDFYFLTFSKEGQIKSVYEEAKVHIEYVCICVFVT